MRIINEEINVAYDEKGHDIQADRLQRWAYNQLACTPDLLEALKLAKRLMIALRQDDVVDCDGQEYCEKWYMETVEQAIAKAEKK